jgi:hypothetical protein
MHTSALFDAETRRSVLERLDRLTSESRPPVGNDVRG